MPYSAPLKDIQFVINHLSHWSELKALPAYAEVDDDTVAAILEEMAKLCTNVLAPLNHAADKAPSYWQDGKVITSAGFKDAFDQFIAAGWQGLGHPTEYGGQALPKVLSTACMEMLNSANLSFALCPLLTDGAVEALLVAASDELKKQWVPLLLSGQVTGTMNLTESQAGSDLAAVKTRATLHSDGIYRIYGNKIFITYGDHDLSANILHLVLARIDGAPAGIKGISLFAVPKFLLDAAGQISGPNDVECITLEHKLGIKASPTAVLEFGSKTGAIGYLVGEAHHGLEYMFVMMNAARFGVGVQGIAVAQRASDQALAYARERMQGKTLGGAPTIIGHPDVARMLLNMRALTEGARALAFVAAGYAERAHHHPDAQVANESQAIYEFLVPIVKGFSTEMALEVTSLGVQVHGGMGFIEETGAAQYYRDARILPIYEGTTAIQANDLIGRKTLRDNGAVASYLLQEISSITDSLSAHSGLDAEQQAIADQIADALREARQGMQAVVTFVLNHGKEHPAQVFAGSVPYLLLAGLTLAGAQMARAFLIACEKKDEDPAFYAAKIHTAWFYATHLLPRVRALSVSVLNGGDCVTQMQPEWF